MLKLRKLGFVAAKKQSIQVEKILQIVNSNAKCFKGKK